MKYLVNSIAVASLAFLAACQSNGESQTEAAGSPETTQQSTQTSAPTQAQAQQPVQPTLPMAKEAAKQIPDFQFYKVKSGISFTKADITANRNTVFILFDPNCGHCQAEAGMLAKNYNKLKDVNLYFVSMNDPALLVSFLETFGKELVDKPNVEVLYDRNQDFIQKFHVPDQFPANYVYGADGSLKSNWEGDKQIDAILAAYLK